MAEQLIVMEYRRCRDRNLEQKKMDIEGFVEGEWGLREESRSAEERNEWYCY